MQKLKITYSREVDAAYIYLRYPISPSEACKTYACDPIEIDGMVNIDLDSEGRLLGIEVLDSSRKLPQELIQKLKS